MIPDALVEPGNHRQLHGDLQIDPSGRMALEDRLNELLLQVVEIRVHVVDRRCLGCIVLDE